MQSSASLVGLIVNGCLPAVSGVPDVYPEIPLYCRSCHACSIGSQSMIWGSTRRFPMSKWGRGWGLSKRSSSGHAGGRTVACASSGTIQDTLEFCVAVGGSCAGAGRTRTPGLWQLWEPSMGSSWTRVMSPVTHSSRLPRPACRAESPRRSRRSLRSSSAVQLLLALQARLFSPCGNGAPCRTCQHAFGHFVM